MTIALYQGRGLVGGIIRKFTRSRYSHVALQFPDGVIFEAVPEGVKRSTSLGERHRAGIVVDLFAYIDPLTETQLKRARMFCEAIEGAPYDYGSVLSGFPLRTSEDSSHTKWFCSEVVLAASIAAKRPLQIMPPWKCLPDHIAISPELKWIESIVL